MYPKEKRAVRIIFILLIFFAESSVCWNSFAQDTSSNADYIKYYELAKSYENQKLYINALSSYLDAMSAEPTEKAQGAFDGFKRIADALRSGLPGPGKFTDAQMQEGWKRLQVEYDAFWIKNCPRNFDFGQLYKEKLGYGKQDTLYTIFLDSEFTLKYRLIYEIVREGYKKSYMYNWKGMVSTWPETASNGVESSGMLVMGKTYLSAVFAPELYSIEFSVLDSKGSILLEGGKVSPGSTYSFVNPSSSVQKKLDLGIKNNDLSIRVDSLCLSWGNAETFTPQYSYNLPEMKIGFENVRITQPYVRIEKERNAYELIAFRNTLPSMLTMIKVEDGAFDMGSKSGYARERPVHKLNMSGFEMSDAEVTQILYELVMGENPSFYVGDFLPVERVSWYDAIYFCNKLSSLTGDSPCYSVDGETDIERWNYVPHKGLVLEGEIACDFNAKGYRLPTEAEWEYAAAEGKGNASYRYSGSSTADNVAWTKNNAEGTTHEAGSKKANKLGFFNMSGNVAEWCWDFYDPGYYYGSPEKDPKGPADGDGRIVRGGHIFDPNEYCRMADRSNFLPEVNKGLTGIRLVKAK